MTLKQQILISVAILLLFTLFFFIIFSDHGIVDLKELRKQEAVLAKKNEALVQENIRLYRSIERLNNDLGYIENVARQELGMIGKDEVIFKLNRK
ncbi:septum formation initiator family protein [Thermodesulfobacteriota bacterium]